MSRGGLKEELNGEPKCRLDKRQEGTGQVS